MDWRTVLFGWPPRDKPAPKPSEPQAAVEAVAAPSVGDGGEVYARMPEAELRSSKQHHLLFDEGVLRWNQHRHDSDFIPKFAGLNFLKEAARTRLWGRPADIIGDERVILAGVNWAFADLQGATLSRADLRNARLVGADLRNANLSGALLHGADLTDCDLRGAILDGAQFARAKLVHANMLGASLRNTNFAWANMTNAAVSARSLQDANMFGAIRDSVATHIRPAPHPTPAQG
jgi:uncharacterized protein YjbI with pentapeptide repeats